MGTITDVIRDTMIMNTITANIAMETITGFSTFSAWASLRRLN
jgi:hypothetical protein